MVPETGTHWQALTRRADVRAGFKRGAALPADALRPLREPALIIALNYPLADKRK